MRTDILHAVISRKEQVSRAKTVRWNKDERVRAGFYREEWSEDHEKLSAEELPPCAACPVMVFWFCAVTEGRCRSFVSWVEEIR